MSTSIKLGLATAGIGTLAGGGYLASKLLEETKTSLGQELQNKGHTLLNFDTSKTDDEAIWGPIIAGYVAGSKKFTDLPTITVSNNKPSKDNIDALKKECEKAINSSKYENSTLLNAEQWCTAPITIKELVGKGRAILNSDDNSNINEKEWDEKVEKYANDSRGNKLNEVQINKPITPENKATERNKLKNGCRAIENNKTHNKDFHKHLEQFVEWCSNPK